MVKYKTPVLRGFKIFAIVFLFSGCMTYEADYRYNVKHILEIDPIKANRIIRDSLIVHRDSKYWNAVFKEINI